MHDIKPERDIPEIIREGSDEGFLEEGKVFEGEEEEDCAEGDEEVLLCYAGVLCWGPGTDVGEAGGLAGGEGGPGTEEEGEC